MIPLSTSTSATTPGNFPKGYNSPLSTVGSKRRKEDVQIQTVASTKLFKANNQEKFLNPIDLKGLLQSLPLSTDPQEITLLSKAISQIEQVLKENKLTTEQFLILKESIYLLLHSKKEIKEKSIALGLLVYYLERGSKIENLANLNSLFAFRLKEIALELQALESEFLQSPKDTRVRTGKVDYLLNTFVHMIITSSGEWNEGGCKAVKEILEKYPSLMQRVFSNSHIEVLKKRLHLLSRDDLFQKKLEQTSFSSLAPSLEGVVRCDLKLEASDQITKSLVYQTCLKTVLYDLRQRDGAKTCASVSFLNFFLQYSPQKIFFLSLTFLEEGKFDFKGACFPLTSLLKELLSYKQLDERHEKENISHTVPLQRTLAGIGKAFDIEHFKENELSYNEVIEHYETQENTNNNNSATFFGKNYFSSFNFNLLQELMVRTVDFCANNDLLVGNDPLEERFFVGKFFKDIQSASLEFAGVAKEELKEAVQSWFQQVLKQFWFFPVSNIEKSKGIDGLEIEYLSERTGCLAFFHQGEFQRLLFKQDLIKALYESALTYSSSFLDKKEEGLFNQYKEALFLYLESSDFDQVIDDNLKIYHQKTFLSQKSDYSKDPLLFIERGRNVDEVPLFFQTSFVQIFEDQLPNVQEYILTFAEALNTLNDRKTPANFVPLHICNPDHAYVIKGEWCSSLWQRKEEESVIHFLKQEILQPGQALLDEPIEQAFAENILIFLNVQEKEWSKELYVKGMTIGEFKKVLLPHLSSEESAEVVNFLQSNLMLVSVDELPFLELLNAFVPKIQWEQKKDTIQNYILRRAETAFITPLKAMQIIREILLNLNHVVNEEKLLQNLCSYFKLPLIIPFADLNYGLYSTDVVQPVSLAVTFNFLEEKLCFVKIVDDQMILLSQSEETEYLDAKLMCPLEACPKN